MVADILSTLKSLHYSGDQRNFTFDKYCTAHVDQHNCHATLAKWNVKPLEETMKIHYFKGGITDPSFASVKSTILVDRTKFQDFDTVMWLYVNYKAHRRQKPWPIKPVMSLLSKVAEVVGKAMGDVEEADKVDSVAA
jgi:hypothetical protein